MLRGLDFFFWAIGEPLEIFGRNILVLLVALTMDSVLSMTVSSQLALPAALRERYYRYFHLSNAKDCGIRYRMYWKFLFLQLWSQKV
jgi:hypothetical protein